MKAAAAILLLAVGLGAGWFLRDATVEEHDPARVERSDTQVAKLQTPETDGAPAISGGKDVGAEEPRSDLVGGGESTDEHAAPAAEAEETEEEENPLAQLMKGMLGNKGFIKDIMTMESKQRAAHIALALDLDPERTKLLEEAFAKDAERGLEGFAGLFEKGEIDLSKLKDMKPEEGAVSEALEQDLAGFLNGHEIDTVKKEVKKEKERKQTQQIEMQIANIGVSDLSDDQRTQLRDYYKNKNSNRKSSSDPEENAFAEMIAGKGEMDTDDMMKAIEKNNAKEREHMARILNPKQLQRYDIKQRQQLEQQKMGMKMFGTMFKAGKGDAKGGFKIKFGASGSSEEK
ncbi:MAG: hypothetical protein V3T86_14740 [Planctomycetota bacterium]